MKGALLVGAHESTLRDGRRQEEFPLQRVPPEVSRGGEDAVTFPQCPTDEVVFWGNRGGGGVHGCFHDVTSRTVGRNISERKAWAVKPHVHSTAYKQHLTAIVYLRQTQCQMDIIILEGARRPES